MSHSTRMYAWEGTTINGNKINGRTEGRSQAFVRAELLRQGIRAARVRPASRMQWRWPAGQGKADAAGFSRQLATLLRAGRCAAAPPGVVRSVVLQPGTGG